MVIETALLATALFEVTKKLAEKGIIDPALEKGLEPFRNKLTGFYDSKRSDEDLRKVFTDVIQKMGASAKDKDQLSSWLKNVGLDRLQSEKNAALRRQMALALIGFTDKNAAPPDDLMVALGWPRSRTGELSKLLANLRAGLVGTSWQPVLDYANEARKQDLLTSILAQLSEWNNLMVLTDNGQALRVVVEKQGLTSDQAAKIERRYRDDLVRELYWHNFRGIVQVKQDTRLPLTDIYLELGILEFRNREEQEKFQQRMSTVDEPLTQLAERRIEERVSNGIAKAQRLVILGDPGMGKTISLRFITLMLAYGFGAARIGLEQPYIPLFVRLADYARELEKRPALTLDNYLFEYIQQTHSGSDRLGEFLRFALDQGKCVLLLDGLDEVATDLKSSKSSHAKIINEVEKLGSVWCDGKPGNRLIVTSRIEGYWNDPLHGFANTQLSPLRRRNDMEAFLLQWFTAHEQAHNHELPYDRAAVLAQKRVNDLLPRILSTPSVRRLAANPLLLTILALIDDNLGKLPNRRITLYRIASQTLIESWRQIQVGLPDELLAELGDDKIIRLMSPLAYWLHENRPGGAASTEDWQRELVATLIKEGFEREAEDLASRFLYHARFQTGILAERSLGQFGFFHLTFEEYLAARQIARQRAEERREMLKKHWQDARWQEVILLAAGQLGIEEARTDDASDFLEDLLKMEPRADEENGRPALLAGRALVDIGSRSVTPTTRRWVEKALRYAAQDIDPDTEKPSLKTQVQPRIRAECADLAEELGYRPEDLYSFVSIPNSQSIQFLLAKSPVTNAQYARFLRPENFTEKALWCGFLKFDKCGENKAGEDWGVVGWEWLQTALKGPDWTVENSVLLPRFWRDVRFGIVHPYAPVVGVSWYEANAYCKWLLLHWDDLEEGKQGLEKPNLLRLPTEKEWVVAAGDEAGDRFSWGELKDPQEIVRYANTSESGIKRTTPVWMYPAGTSQPYGLLDMSGNVWEWQANYRDDDFAWRGGSWYVNQDLARIPAGDDYYPYYWSYDLGFRVLALPI
jgi:predicted NACHT family NTPase/formylglycine-generating enzyme required for sulfatase activity